jgi:hypothetical protein
MHRRNERLQSGRDATYITAGCGAREREPSANYGQRLLHVVHGLQRFLGIRRYLGDPIETVLNRGQGSGDSGLGEAIGSIKQRFATVFEFIALRFRKLSEVQTPIAENRKGKAAKERS